MSVPKINWGIGPENTLRRDKQTTAKKLNYIRLLSVKLLYTKLISVI